MPMELDSQADPLRKIAFAFFPRGIFFEKTMEYDVWVESVKTQPLPREKLLSPILHVFLIPRFFWKKTRKAINTGI